VVDLDELVEPEVIEPTLAEAPEVAVVDVVVFVDVEDDDVVVVDVEGEELVELGVNGVTD